MVGTYIPIYFMVEDSWASFAASFGEEYADRVMAVMPMWSIILVVAGIFVFAILGGLLGKAPVSYTHLPFWKSSRKRCASSTVSQA